MWRSPTPSDRTISPSSRSGPTRRAERVALAVAPLAVALALLAVLAAAGTTQRSLAGTILEDRFYGFFLDRYPLFLFALAYGIAAIPCAAATSRRPLPWRWAGAALGAALLLAAGLYPTFGGVILRAGFMTGGMAFLTHQPGLVAEALGALAAALVFGSVLETGGLLVRLRPLHARWPARLAAAIGSLAALWWAMAVLSQGRAFGLDRWPRGALDAPQAALAAVLVLAAFLPHTLLRATLPHRPG